MHKYKINNSYINFESFILNIQNYFKLNTNSIHKARNEIKIISYQNSTYVVKSFKVPHLLNKIVYTFFRDSKAKKSYENSMRIADFVPYPIGYIEFYKFGLINDSYFVSENFTYDFTIREPLLDDNFKNKEDVFKAFAKFTFDLHENSILHKDYSPGNILVKEENENYVFKVVDINRMEFRRLSLDERLKSFSKLWAKDEDLKIIVKEYAQLMDINEMQCVDRALAYSKEHKYQKNIKKRLKGKKVVD